MTCPRRAHASHQPRPSLTGLAVFIGLLALFIGRTVPRPQTSRRPAACRFQGVNGTLLPKGETLLLDLLTGGVQIARSPDPNLAVEFPSCSPWQDTQGRWQIVARWKRRPQEPQGLGTEPFCGLLRFRYPDGRLIDLVECEMLPIGPPAWVHATAARLVFASGDGNLNLLDFETPSGRAVEAAGGIIVPRPLRWSCDMPGAASVSFSDVSCPARLPGGPWLLVAASSRDADRHAARAKPSQIWWLRLSPDGAAVVSVGRVTTDDPRRPPEVARNERFPVLTAARSGGLVLAYLAENPSGVGWSLRVVPVEIGSVSGVPIARPSEALTLAENALLNPPGFSPDGRWVYAVLGVPGSAPRVERLANPLDDPSDGARGAPGPTPKGRPDFITAAGYSSDVASGSD